MPEAIANVTALIPSYRSATEEAWARVGNLYISDLMGTGVAIELYEPLKFNLPGGWYTPDFGYVMDNGWLVFVEVKGSKKQKNYRDARSKLRAAAAVYPFFTWAEAVGGADGFELEVVNG